MTPVTQAPKHKKQRRRLPPWLMGLLLAMAIFAVGLIVANLFGFGDDPTFGDVDSAPATSAQASSDTGGIALTYFDGSGGSFDDFQGKPLVLNFWASWCPACIAEMPDFEEVHARLGGSVQFLGVNLSETNLDAAERLVAETGVTYPLALDPDGLLYAQFDGIAMPTSVFIDENGNIVDTHSGVIFADDLEAKLREVFDL